MTSLSGSHLLLQQTQWKKKLNYKSHFVELMLKKDGESRLFLLKDDKIILYQEKERGRICL
jgi:hypothetical protein